jgi:hypothetical protein
MVPVRYLKSPCNLEKTHHFSAAGKVRSNLGSAKPMRLGNAIEKLEHREKVPK